MTTIGKMTSADRDRHLKRAMLTGVIVRLASFPLSFITVALATRALGPTQYGVLAAALAIMTFTAVSDLGVGRAMVMQLANEHGRDDLAAMQRTVSSAFATTAVMGLIVGGGLLLSTLWVPWAKILGAPALDDSTVVPAIIVLGVAMLLTLPFARGGAVLSGMQRDSVSQQWALGAVLISVVAATIAYLVDGGLGMFALAMLGAPVLIKLAEFTWVSVRAFPELRPKLSLMSWPVSLRLLKAGPPYAVIHLSMLALSVDLVILGYRSGAAAAAVFAITVSLFTPVWSSLLMAVNQLWAAMNEAVSRGDHQWVRTRLRKTLVLGFVLSAGASIVVALLAKPITKIWVGEEFVAPTLALLLAVPWVVYSVLIYQLGSVLSATGKNREQGILATVAIVVNGVVVWFTTETFGVAGAYAGTLATYVVIVGIPSVLMVRRALRTLGTVEPTAG